MMRRLAVTVGRLLGHVFYIFICWLLEEQADSFEWYQRGPAGAEA